MTPRTLRLLVYAATAALSATFVAAHGTFVKPCFNAEDALAGVWLNPKVNGTVRGSVVGGEANQLYLMDPPLNHTGYEDVIGYRVTLQDEEASTPEFVELSMVRYAKGGYPDETPAGIIHKATYPAFGFFSGQLSFDFIYTFGLPLTLPVVNHGVGLLLPANAGWPADGATVHGQLNVPGDPLRPRVAKPYNSQVWSFERPARKLEVRPLHARALDTLLMTTIFITDPVVQTYVISDVYGNGPEKLFGPESMHPVASQGDELGFFLQGGNDGQTGVAYFLVSTGLAANPFQFAPASGNDWFYLEFIGTMPVLLMTGTPNPTHGRLTTQSIPFSWFPSNVQDFWVQVLLHYPNTTGPIQYTLTDAVGVRGL